MTIRTLLSRSGKTLVLSAALAGVIGMTAIPQPAHALGTGAAVGIGLGALALGTALGAATNPYYNPGYYYPPQYYPAAPAPYAAPQTCWSPYYQTYIAC